MRPQLSSLLCLALASFGLLAAEPAAVTTEEGELAGATFTVAVPAHWNGRLLLLAHGLRPESVPLYAKLFTDLPPVSALLAQDWMVAITSYRRNGVVIRRAITDLERLRTHIAEKYGPPQHTYLMGDSMGGLIVTLMMEQFPEKYSGAVAIGAALHMAEPEPTVSLRHQPRRPLLFLTNQSELPGPVSYVEAAAQADVPPVLWVVARDGHVNVNAAERLLALGAVQRWAEAGTAPLAQRNATMIPQPGPSQISIASDGSATGRVTFVHPISGSFIVNFQPADFERLGLKFGQVFHLVAADGTLIPVVYRRNPEEAESDRWVCTPEAEGFIAIGRPGRNAATGAHLKKGDAVVLRPLKTG